MSTATTNRSFLAGVRSSDTWSPLGNSVFRALWFAVLLTQIGNWMATVGAQWVLVSQPNNETLVALVQTADTLPVMLLALPAGVLADAFDRRLLLLSIQVFLAINATMLAFLSATNALTPALLLLLTFLDGAGAGVTAPTWQAMIPDLIPRSQLRSAAVLGSVSVNVGRAIGPAIAGVLIALVGVGAVFGFNALTYFIFALVLLRSRVPHEAHESRRERFLPALRVGSAYVRWSPFVRSVLVRAALFLLPAIAVWALLPLVATDLLGLDAAGYGVLLGALGVGAIGGVVVIGRIRARWTDDLLIARMSLVYAVAMAVVVLVPSVFAVIAALLFAGLAWMAVLSTVNATLQLFLPGWVRARGLAIYMIVLFGSQAIGAAAWGFIASAIGLVPAVVAAAIVMAAGIALGRLWRLQDVSSLDRGPAQPWPEARLAFQPDLDIGPVIVEGHFRVPAANADAFIEAMERVERTRRRTGATDWQLLRDGEDPTRFVELFEVPSWDAHARQHRGRLTGSDAEAENAAHALTSEIGEVRHYFPADAVPDVNLDESDVTVPAEPET